MKSVILPCPLIVDAPRSALATGFGGEELEAAAAPRPRPVAPRLGCVGLWDGDDPTETFSEAELLEGDGAFSAALPREMGVAGATGSPSAAFFTCKQRDVLHKTKLIGLTTIGKCKN